MALGKPLHLRLFLEGQEVPVISAQVSTGIWAPSAAAIQIVPIDQGIEFKPRTMVHLFFLGDPKADPVVADAVDPTNFAGLEASYKLLFVGEIVGFSFVKTPMSRGVVLQCLDHSSYWDVLQATMMDWGPQGNALWNKGAVYGSNTSIFANVPTKSQAEKLKDWINTKPKTPHFKNIGGLAGGILRMMEVMGGVQDSELGVNDFFTIGELRNHLLGQVTAEDGDDTARRLLNHKVFFDWLFGNLQNQSGQISLRDMFKLLCSYIYYAIVPNPTARYTEDNRLLTQIFRPDCFMAAPPVCNVIFPEQYTQMTYDRNFLQEVTRVEIGYYAHITNDQNALTSHYVLEPRLMDMAQNVMKNIGHKWRVLMDHERHTGILAKEEWLPDSFGRFRSTDTEDAKQFKNATLTWQQRTGLFHFFKYRIGSRTMSVGARFLPNVVCGFPALIIQKPFTVRDDDKKGLDDDKLLDAILTSKNAAVEWKAPPQFLGLVESVQHNIGQDGGTTQISMSHCRSHLGIDDEFVGKSLDQLRTTGKNKRLVNYTLLYDTEKEHGDQKRLNFLRDCTKQQDSHTVTSLTGNRKLEKKEVSYFFQGTENGKPAQVLKATTVTSATETSSTKTGESSTSETPDPHSAAGDTVLTPNPVGVVTVGSSGLYGGTVKLIKVESPVEVVRVDGINYFRSITVYEELSSSFKTDDTIPLEYVVQPSWMSTSYDNENIGKKVYQPFFGCDSIVDPVVAGIALDRLAARIPEDGLVVEPEDDEKSLRLRFQLYDSKRKFYSIERAVNMVAFLYGKVRASQKDVDAFISTYTRRPIATKLDVLGSADLQLEFEGQTVVRPPKTGTIGFHTLSVHPACVKMGKLVGLLDDPTIQMTRMSNKQKEAVKADYDVRDEKLERVQSYIDALREGGRGFQG